MIKITNIYWFRRFLLFGVFYSALVLAVLSLAYAENNPHAQKQALSGHFAVMPLMNSTGHTQFDWLSIALQESLTLDLWYLPVGTMHTLLQYQENIAKRCPTMQLTCLQQLQLSDWQQLAIKQQYQYIFWGDYTLDDKSNRQDEGDNTVFRLRFQLWDVATGQKLAEQTALTDLAHLTEKSGLLLLALLKTQGVSMTKKQQARVLHPETHHVAALKANALGYWAQQQYALASNEIEKQRLEQLWQQQLQQAVRLDPHYANAWSNLGWYFSAMKGKNRVGREHAFQQALQANAEHPDALDGLGTFYHEQKNDQQALTLLKPLPTIAPSMLHRYLSLIWVYKAMGNKEKELTMMGKQSLLLNDLESAKTLNKLAIRHYKRGEYQQALPLLQRSIAIYERQPHAKQPDIANSLNSLAVLYNKLEHYEKAEALHQRALAIRQKHFGIEHIKTTSSLNNLGLLYQTLGRYKEALPLLQHALKIRQKAYPMDHLDIARSLNSLALLYVSLFKYDKAKPLYKRALAIREQQLDDDDPDIAVSLNNLADLYHLMGYNDKVEALFRRALAIYKKKWGDEHPDTIGCLNNLAVFYDSMGAYAQAEPLYEQALAHYEKKFGAKSAYTAIGLNNLAVFYKEMGRYTKAEILHKRALAIRKNKFGIKHLYTANSMNNLGLLYQVMRKYKKAESLLQQVLAIREQQLGDTHLAVATSLNNLAVLYQAMDANNKAEPLLHRSLKICHQLGENHPYTARNLNNLAELYRTMKLFSKAEPLYQDALVIQEKHFGKEYPYLSVNLANYALSLKQQNHPQAAIFFAKLAVNSLQLSRQKNRALPKALKSSFIGHYEFTYRALVEWLLDAHRLQEAEHVMAMYKEKEVADYFKKALSVTKNRPATLLHFTADEKQWNVAYQKMTQTLHKTFQYYQDINEKPPAARSEKEKQQRQQLTTDMLETEYQLHAFFDKIGKEWTKTPQTQVAIQAPDALQKTLAQLDKGTVILSYFVQEDKVRLLLTTATTRILRESLVSAEELRQQIQDYRIRLKQKGAVRPLSQELHKQLIDPIIADLKQMNTATILFSLDDALRYLPMAALHDSDSYLVERYGLGIYTAAVGYNNLTVKPKENTGIIALGVTKRAEIPPVPPDEQAYTFPALPYVASELQGIVLTTEQDKEARGIIAGKYYLDDEVTKNILIHALSPSSKKTNNIVHLATHFQLTSGNGYQSFLLLGKEKTLSLAELYQHPEIDFNTIDLLTASACNTTMTTIQVQTKNETDDFNFHAVAQQRGAEVESFAAIAQQKGAKAVLASLWSVNDRSTGILMQNFYRHWKQGTSEISSKLEKPVSKLVALQKAQLSFIQQGKHVIESDCPAIQLPGMPLCADRVSYPEQSHPYYWAAFMLIGNGL